jgi:hypothetical protein
MSAQVISGEYPGQPSERPVLGAGYARRPSADLTGYRAGDTEGVYAERDPAVTAPLRSAFTDLGNADLPRRTQTQMRSPRP